MKKTDKNDIAIIGIAGRFPDAENLEELYQNLRSGKDSIRKISKKRIIDTGLPVDGEYLVAGYMKDIDKFDHALFNIVPGEARSISPHQRQLLEVAHECFENAGYNIDDIFGSKTATFIAHSNSDYIAKKKDNTTYNGGTNSFWASRLTSYFNFRGPASIVETNCSSGLVALRFACNELKVGGADMAFVGGANIYSYPFKRSKNKLDVYSKNGKTEAFGDKASGMTFGEAVIGILLKPLDKARKDNDVIHAVVKSVAVNNNANRSSSPSAPDSVMQSEVIVDAWEQAGIDPLKIGYIEAHGSGTKLGDGLEIEGLNMAIKKYGKAYAKIPLSTIKSNIGHSSSVAGLAGLCRSVLSLEKKEIFPMANFKKANSLIDFKNSAFLVNEELKGWPAQKGITRLAGVTSLGISGVNAHAVLAEAPKPKETKTKKTQRDVLVTFSAHTENCLKKDFINFKKHLENNDITDLSNVAYTLNKHRQVRKYRWAVVVKSKKELIGELSRGIKSFGKNKPRLRKVLFVFSSCPGQISSAQLQKLSEYKVFSKQYKKILAGHRSNTNVRKFAFQFAFYKLLESFNIKCDSMIGDDFGMNIIDLIAGKSRLNSVLDRIIDLNITSTKNKHDAKKKIKNKFGGATDSLFIPMIPGSQLGEILLSANTGKISTVLDFGKEKDILAETLRHLFINNKEIAWKEYCKDFQLNRVSLPSRSFEKTSCWLVEEKDNNFTAHPKPETAYFGLNHDQQKDLVAELRAIWQNILQVKTVLDKSDFFELGGHSLLATKLILEIQDKLGVDLDFEDVFDYSVFGDFCDYLRTKIASDNDLTQRLVDIYGEVLMVDNINKDSDFFELGGHSLLATQIINRVEKNFGIVLNFQEIFDHPTPSALAIIIETRTKGVTFVKEEMANTQPVKSENKLFKCSHSQKRMWVLNQLNPGSPFYNIRQVINIKGKLNADILEDSFNYLVERQASLRTNIVEIDGEPWQKIHKNRKIKINFFDISSSTAGKKTNEDKIINQEISTPFKLEKDMLIKVALIIKKENPERPEDNEYTLIITMHHIITDGWSVGVIYRELSTIYNSLNENKKFALPALNINYWDYAEQEQSRENLGKFQEHENYWFEKLGGRLPVLKLPTDNPRPRLLSFNGSTERNLLEPDEVKLIKEFAKEHKVSRFVLLISALYVLLGKYSKQNDIIIGTPSANRKTEDLKNLVGVFLNIVPLRMEVNQNETFEDLLDNVRRSVFEAYEHEDVPFEYLLDKLKPERDLSRSPLFSVMFQYDPQNKNVLNLNGATTNLRKGDTNTTKFDFKIRVRELDKNNLLVLCEYNTDLYSRKSAQDLLHSYRNILRKLLADPNRELKGLQIDLGNLGKQRVYPVTNKENKKMVAHKPLPETKRKIRKIWQDILDVRTVKDSDSFFDLGGHSLKGVRLLARVNREMGTKLKLISLFGASKFNDFVNLIPRSSKAAVTRERSGGSNNTFPLTRNQFVSWQTAGKHPGKMNIYSIINPGLKISEAMANKIFTDILDRHEALRVNFVETEKGEYKQIIKNKAEFRIVKMTVPKDIDTHDLSSIKEYIVQEATSNPFDLKNDALIRVYSVDLKNRTVFVLCAHHFVFDKGSTSIIKQEFQSLYNYYQNQSVGEYPLTKLEYNYRDYLNFENSDLPAQNEYWANEFKTGVPVMEMSEIDLFPVAKISKKSHSRGINNSKPMKVIGKICQSHDVTLFTFFATVYSIFLSNLFSKKEVLFGYSANLRDKIEMRKVVGFLVNNLAMKQTIEKDVSFTEALANTRTKVAGAMENKNVPFNYLIRKKIIKAQVDKMLLNIFLSIYNLDELNIDLLKDLDLEVRSEMKDFSPLDIEKSVYLQKNKLVVCLNFNSKIIDKRKSLLMIELYKKVLMRLLNDPDKQINKLFTR